MKPPKGLDWPDVLTILVVLVGIMAFSTYMAAHFPAVKSTESQKTIDKCG